jgi:hypothetical protein
LKNIGLFLMRKKETLYLIKFTMQWKFQHL